MTTTGTLKTYVVYEGLVYDLTDPNEYLDRYCSQKNWMSDWLFAMADNPINALKIAEIVDEGPRAAVRVYRKVCDVREKRDALLKKDLMTPTEIWESVVNPEHRTSMSFNQQWFSLK
jgi:hypothetical protein